MRYLILYCTGIEKKYPVNRFRSFVSLKRLHATLFVITSSNQRKIKLFSFCFHDINRCRYYFLSQDGHLVLFRHPLNLVLLLSGQSPRKCLHEVIIFCFSVRLNLHALPRLVLVSYYADSTRRNFFKMYSAL